MCCWKATGSVLTDFGIAALEGDATRTRSGAVLSTPAYMSPEQVHGETATFASDLWALGATLYATVEGRPPFTAPTHGALFVAIATRERSAPVRRTARASPGRPTPKGSRRPAVSCAGPRLLTAVAGPGERPPDQDRPPGPESATRVDSPGRVHHGRRCPKWS
ncbi:protein kinase domain-containing protein [Actinomadura welshii]|uniref:protein kinase domain-containing protein n=1 Tax=Actinomadura welshii TaxID=3103817 RepID=UPI0003FCBF23